MTLATQVDEPVSFGFDNTRIFLQALQALSLGKQQILRTTVTPDGITFRCEDEGKACQSSVYFPSGFFSHFAAAAQQRVFSVHLPTLLDALRVLAAVPHLSVRATQYEERLALEALEDERGTTTCMYAHITILGTAHFRSLMDSWQPPATEFVTAPAVLKEAIDDLEWLQGSIRIRVTAAPVSVTLQAEGSVGELSIRIPGAALKSVVAQLDPVDNAYAFKYLKTALTGLGGVKGGGQEVSSRLAIDANGMLKAVHMMGAAAGGASAPQDAMAHHTQAMSTVVVLTYFVLPAFNDED